MLHRANVVWTNLCRFVLGVTFIFSGFVKADDPWGTAYKIEDYVYAFGWSDFVPSFLPYHWKVAGKESDTSPGTSML